MKRRELMKQLGKIAAELGVELTVREGGSHVVVYFDGRKVTIVARHSEINEHTARGILRDARNWEK